MATRRNVTQLVFLVLLCSTVSFSSTPVGDGVTNDTAAIQGLLNAAIGTCATVQLQCTQVNRFKVTKPIQVPACVKFVGACGGVPDEGSSTTIGTTLAWGGTDAGPVVLFHDSPGASMSGISVDCNNVSNGIGILYDSDDKPSASFVNIDTLMIKGCHQGLVVGVAAASPVASVAQCINNAKQPGCYQADQLKLERYRILGNLNDPTGEGIHINSANAAQGSLIANGNIQGVNLAIHVIMTNGGLVIQSSNMGSQVGTNPTFVQIESNVVNSPALINDEVEGNASAVVDHSCNPEKTPGTPVWLYNTWNQHPIVVDGCESITSIGNIGNNAVVSNAAAHVLSLGEGNWSVAPGLSPGSLTTLASGVGNFGDSVWSHNYVAAVAPNCPSPASFPVVPQAGDLVSCESSHGGRLFLGQDLMLQNNGDGTLDTAGLLRIQTGLYQDGGGLKHQTMSTGSVTGGSTIQLPFNWATTFPDSSYQAVCSVQDSTGSLQVVSTAPPTPAAVTVFVKNNDAHNAHVGSLVCFAIHN